MDPLCSCILGLALSAGSGLSPWQSRAARADVVEHCIRSTGRDLDSQTHCQDYHPCTSSVFTLCWLCLWNASICRHSLSYWQDDVIHAWPLCQGACWEHVMRISGSKSIPMPHRLCVFSGWLDQTHEIRTYSRALPSVLSGLPVKISYNSSFTGSQCLNTCRPAQT